MNRRMIVGLTGLFLLPQLALAHEYQVGGSNPDAGVHVTICHATGNGFVEISPSVTGVLNGHVDHQDGRDIIPPFHFHVNVGSQSPEYEGREFAGQGDQSILENGCEESEGEPTDPVPHADADAFCVDGEGQEDFPGDNLGIVEVDSWITPDDYEGVVDFQVTISNPYQQERYTVFPGTVYNESYSDHEGSVRVRVATEDDGVFFDETFTLECDVPELEPSPSPEPSSDPTPDGSSDDPPVDDGTNPPAPQEPSSNVPLTSTDTGSTLPFTGVDLSDFALIAATMLIVGAGAWLVARKQGI